MKMEISESLKMQIYDDLHAVVPPRVIVIYGSSTAVFMGKLLDSGGGAQG